MSEEICFMSAFELAACIRQRKISCVEAVEAFLDRTKRRNSVINAYVTLMPEKARQKAQQADAVLASGKAVGPLHGVPVAIKDLVDFWAGVRNTFGCKVFVDFIPDVTITYVQRLEDAGAVILGKTNTSEFGHKGVTDNFLFGPTSTPFAIGKNAGGSSGGSAAAVADGMAAVAQGSDAGGSVRIPASFCGVYGFKASHGRVAAVSRPDGFVSHTPFIQAGPITRTVRDAALMLQVMAGPDPGDPLSLPEDGVNYLSAVRQRPQNLKIAYSQDLDVFPVEAEVQEVVSGAVRTLQESGAFVEEVHIGLQVSQQELCDLWLKEMAVLYAAMAASFVFDGIDLLGDHVDHLSPQFAALIERGNTLSAVDYKLMDVLRTEVYDAFQNLFSKYDLLVCPTLSVLPFDNAADGNTLGPSAVNGQAVDSTIGWCLTYPFNFTGHPVASVPAGLSHTGLPVGLQIVGRRFDEVGVLAASALLEEVRPWVDQYMT